MGKKFRIRAEEARNYSGNIKPTDVEPPVGISFNFRHLNDRIEKFRYDEQETQYFFKLLERLRGISQMDRKALVNSHDKSLRFHPINFKDGSVSERTFGLGEEIDDDAWQFGISANKHGRVHGYFVRNIFFPVWLDPGHNLYSGRT